MDAYSGAWPATVETYVKAKSLSTIVLKPVLQSLLDVLRLSNRVEREQVAEYLSRFPSTFPIIPKDAHRDPGLIPYVACALRINVVVSYESGMIDQVMGSQYDEFLCLVCRRASVGGDSFVYALDDRSSDQIGKSARTSIVKVTRIRQGPPLTSVRVSRLYDNVRFSLDVVGHSTHIHLVLSDCVATVSDTQLAEKRLQIKQRTINPVMSLKKDVNTAANLYLTNVTLDKRAFTTQRKQVALNPNTPVVRPIPVLRGVAVSGTPSTKSMEEAPYADANITKNIVRTIISNPPNSFECAVVLSSGTKKLFSVQVNAVITGTDIVAIKIYYLVQRNLPSDMRSWTMLGFPSMMVVKHSLAGSQWYREVGMQYLVSAQVETLVSTFYQTFTDCLEEFISHRKLTKEEIRWVATQACAGRTLAGSTINVNYFDLKLPVPPISVLSDTIETEDCYNKLAACGDTLVARSVWPTMLRSAIDSKSMEEFFKGGDPCPYLWLTTCAPKAFTKSSLLPANGVIRVPCGMVVSERAEHLHQHRCTKILTQVPDEGVNGRAIKCRICSAEYIHPLLAYYCCNTEHGEYNAEYAPVDPRGVFSGSATRSSLGTESDGSADCSKDNDEGLNWASEVIGDDDDYVGTERAKHLERLGERV
ncbi:P5 gene product [Spissistilus festinus reovirus]|uniref:P5 n=1 Tax=Spissistilus festinus reovirus TaxID=1004049 RepID=UPI00024D9470|nr:P5 gene product [Spissistilus festinus reovirus]AEC32491.1 P5 [Spissistilus festinus reovirus]